MNVEHLGGYDYGGHLPKQIKQFNDGFREQVQNDNPSRAKLQQLKQRYSNERLTDENREQLAFTSAGVYSAWAYLPAAMGIKLAASLNLPLIWYVYLARLMCLLVWLMLTYLALRLMPFGKSLLFVVALLPTSVVQATTMGMDGIVNGLSWLIIALTLAVIVKKVRLTLPLLAVIAVLSTYLATTKQGYVLLAAFPLVIQSVLYPVKEKIATHLRIGFGFFLVLLSIWYFRQTAPIADVMHFVQRPGLDVDSANQWGYVFSHPLRVFTMIFIHPFTFAFGGIYAGVVGILTNRMVHLPLLNMLLLYIGLVTAAIAKGRDKKLRVDWKRLRISAALVLFGTFALISLALYVSFTQVGFSRVEGIQGRYFLPLLPLLTVLVPAMPLNRAARFQQYAIPALCLISLTGLLSAAAAML